MSNSLDVINSIQYPINSNNPVIISALVPNMKGMEECLISKANEIAVFTAASETFVSKNINCSIEESITKFKPVIDMA